MYIDRDQRGIISIDELSESELRLLHKALQSYVQCNFGDIAKVDSMRIWRFDREFKNMLKHEK